MKLRFSLRLFLVAFTLLAILFGAAANFAWSIKLQASRHKTAVATLQQLGFLINTDDDGAEDLFQSRTPWIVFSRQWIDPNAYRSTRGLIAHDSLDKFTPYELDKAIAAMRDVRGVEHIYLDIDRLTVRLMRSLSPHRGATKITLRCKSAEPGAERLLSRFPNLEEIELDWPISDETVNAIQNPQKITDLSCDASRLTAASTTKFGEMGQLRRLTLFGTLADPSIFTALAECDAMQQLTLTHGVMNESAAVAIAELDQLKHLDVSESFSIPKNFLAQVAQLEQLHSIDLQQSQFAEPSDLHALATSQSIRSIRMKQLEIGDASLRALTKLPSLEMLTVRGHYGEEHIQAFLGARPSRMLQVYDDEQNGIEFSLNNGNLESRKVPRRIFVFHVGLAR